MLGHFGNKYVVKQEAQGFDQFSIIKDYTTEQASFLKTVKVIPKNRVPNGANTTSSHTILKFRQDDNGKL